MNSMEKIPEIKKPMFCDRINRTLDDLKKEGWKDAWSFHERFTDQ